MCIWACRTWHVSFVCLARSSWRAWMMNLWDNFWSEVYRLQQPRSSLLRRHARLGDSRTAANSGRQWAPARAGEVIRGPADGKPSALYGPNRGRLAPRAPRPNPPPAAQIAHTWPLRRFSTAGGVDMRPHNPAQIHAGNSHRTIAAQSHNPAQVFLPIVATSCKTVLAIRGKRLYLRG